MRNLKRDMLRLVLICGLLTVLAWTTNVAQVNAQSQQWDTKWVPNDTFFFGTVNVQNVLNYEAEDSELRKYLGKRMKEEAGIVMEQVLQAQLIMSGELGDDEAFDRDGDKLLIVKTIFSKPQDFSKMIESSHWDYKEEEINGKKVMVPEEEYAPTFCFPDDKTILMGKVEAIKHVTADEQSMSGLIDRIKESDANNSDVFATFEQNAMTEKFMEMVSKEAEGIPFNLADIAGEAVSGEVSIHFSDGKPIVAHIKAKDAEGAQRLQRAVDALVGLGKTLLPEGRKAIEERELPDFGNDSFKEYMEKQRVFQKEFLNVAERVLEGSATSTDGSTLKMEVTAMGGIGKVVNTFARQMEAGMKMGEQQEEAVIIGDDIRVEERIIEE